MPVVEFLNRHQHPLLITIEPSGRRIEVPHLARAAIRYSLPERAGDRYHVEVGDHGIHVWCEATDHAVDVVLPSPADRLLWILCVEGGWCSGIVDDRPVHVTDLIPLSGTLTAEAFAELVLRAEGQTATHPSAANELRRIEAMFVDCFGQSSVDVAVFHRATRRPFDTNAEDRRSPG